MRVVGSEGVGKIVGMGGEQVMGMMVVMLICSEIQLVMALHFRLRLHRRQSLFSL